MGSKASDALKTTPTTPVSGSAPAAPAAPAQRKNRTFEELKTEVLKDSNVDKAKFDALCALHAMGGAAMVTAAMAGLRGMIKELDAVADSTDHAAAWAALVLDEVSHADHVKAINVLVAKLHASMSMYNAMNSANMRLVYTDSTRDSAVPFIGYTQRKRATPTTDDTWSWSQLARDLWSRGDRAIMMPVSGITGKRESLPLADPALLDGDDDDAIILSDDGQTRLTVNAARAQVRVIDGSSRAINANPSHNCKRQVYALDGATLDATYDAFDAARHEAAAAPATAQQG